MPGAHDYLAGLIQLPDLPSTDERRAVWRRGMATLAQMAENQQPVPLDGLRPEALLAGVRVALSTGLVDDLGFLSRPVAAAALFELASALPAGPEKRDLGRRVLTALHRADAATFIPLATALALASPKALSGPAVRARVALSLQLPASMGTSADGLALALLSRPELEREWLGASSMGALPSRRLAGRLLERAAREAARRAAEGDDSGARVFQRATVRAAWDRLLGDRESLVWRHAATARGLLAQVAPDLLAEIDRELGPRTHPGEGRRAAASLGASVAHDPAYALPRCRELLGGERRQRDPGIAAAMIYGLERAIEVEPEACEELLQEIVRSGEVDALEALVDLRAEHAGSPLGERAVEIALERLRATARPDDDGLAALLHVIANDLELDEGRRRPTLRRRLSAGLAAFASGRDLAAPTADALAAAQVAMNALAAAGEDSAAGRMHAFQALRELDLGLLETSTLSDLVTVADLDEAGAGTRELAGILGRLTEWIVSQEQAPLPPGPVPHPTLRLRRFRTLLHLIDADAGAEDVPGQARRRRLDAFRLLLARARSDPPSPLRRTMCAALARSCDALVREEICELSDVVLAAAHLPNADDLRVLAEASMAPEIKSALAALGELRRAVDGARAGGDGRTSVESLRALAERLPPGTSPRVEALRRVLLATAAALEPIGQARSLAELRPPDGGTRLERLRAAVQYAVQIAAGTRRRLALTEEADGGSPGALEALDAAVERTVRERGGKLGPWVAEASRALRADLPDALAHAIAGALAGLERLPTEPAVVVDGAVPLAPPPRPRLPPWLPPSRLLGGFFVLRPIGAGAAGSVFVARRAEARHDEGAECFALKVPAYNGSNALTLSEEEFLRLFREEAGALLTLPAHRNLAGFVTFDLGARPKPILVMELVPGATLERLLDRRQVSAPFALEILDGVAAGLEAMHGAGIGHLDLKPANIVLRAPQSLGASSRITPVADTAPVPVLVDFGLAGRKIRPGCASPHYGAPEVWDFDSLGRRADPSSTDVYAFGCLAYELLVGRPLFDAESLPALVGSHLAHDGGPPALRALARDRHLAPLAELLAAALRRDPARRAPMGEVRAALRELRTHLVNALH